MERVGSAYRVTDKVNIPDLQRQLQRRIDMVAETAKRLTEVGASGRWRVAATHQESFCHCRRFQGVNRRKAMLREAARRQSADAPDPGREGCAISTDLRSMTTSC